MDTTSYLLVALSNLGPKMFNVSAASGTLSSEDGKVLQQFAKQQYGDPLGPREQRSVLFGFTPSEETSPGTYKLEFKIFYNNRDNDQFVDTVFNETVELVRSTPNCATANELCVVEQASHDVCLRFQSPYQWRQLCEWSSWLVAA